MFLTIAIPSYNRPQQVLSTIKSLLPQLNEEVSIMVLDNCSDIIINDFLTREIDEKEFQKVKVIRNRVNIGMDGNICRCFELCTTPYIWTLSDDDKIEPNAVELILQEIDNYKDHDIIGFNFFSNCCTIYNIYRNGPVLINSTKELAEKMDVFGNWLFVSTGVYKVKEYLKHFRFGFWGSYSMAAFMVPTMIGISQGKTFVLSDKYIVTNIPLKDVSQKWSDFQITLSLITLLEARVGFKKDEYKKFGEKFKYQYVWFGDVVYSILKSVNYNIDLIDDYHIYIYQQIYYRTFEFRDQKFKQKLKYYLCLFLLKNKIFLKLLLRFVPKVQLKANAALSFYLFKR